MEWTENERKLAKICVELVLTYKDNLKFFQYKNIEDVTKWVADQLYQNGFPNIPVGMNWVYLTTKEIADEYRKAHPTDI